MAMTLLMIDFTLIPVSLLALIGLLALYYVRWSRWRDASGAQEGGESLGR